MEQYKKTKQPRKKTTNNNSQQLTHENRAQKWQISENSLISEILYTPELTMSSKLT